MTLRLTNPMGTYLLRDPELIETDRGPALRAEYKLEGDEQWWAAGDFRLDNAAIETVSGQMTMKEVA